MEISLENLFVDIETYTGLTEVPSPLSEISQLQKTF